MFKTKYRVHLDSDKEGFPNRWIIQQSKWYEKGWRFYDGSYITYEDAEMIMPPYRVVKYSNNVIIADR